VFVDDIAGEPARERRPAAPDSRELRRVLGTFATGVTVVTTPVGEHLNGMTANAFTSVSLDPPLVLVCVGEAGRAWRDVAASGRFAVNILSADQEALSVYFASPGRRRGAQAFRDVDHWIGAGGCPILKGTVAYLDCRLAGMHPAGDHVMLIGEVVDLAARPDASPLLFHRGQYVRMA
jgi:flavin reductase (DIM6/NTAB) family NADH-FMN oxidoreductase RutF